MALHCIDISSSNSIACSFNIVSIYNAVFASLHILFYIYSAMYILCIYPCILMYTLVNQCISLHTNVYSCIPKYITFKSAMFSQYSMNFIRA